MRIVFRPSDDLEKDKTFLNAEIGIAQNITDLKLRKRVMKGLEQMKWVLGKSAAEYVYQYDVVREVLKPTHSKGFYHLEL